MNSRNHHYNPQVYLRQFVNPAFKKQLWEYDLKRGSAKQSTPKDSGWEEFYHSFKHSDGTRDDTFLEQSFHVIENKLPTLFENFRNKKILTADDWQTLFYFAELQRVRSPKVLHWVHNAVSKANSAANRKQGLAATRPDPQRAVETESGVEVGRGNTLLSLLAVTWNGKLPGILRGMNWVFLTAPTGSYFFTSDDPVCCWPDRDPESLFDRIVGPANESAEITFPLSRRVCALGSRQHRFEHLYEEASADAVERLNYRTVTNGWRFVYGPTRNEDILRIVQQR